MSPFIVEILSRFPFPVFRRVMDAFGLKPADYMGKIFTTIKPSTITVGGRFIGIADGAPVVIGLHEKTDIDKFGAPQAPLMKVGSNYGEHYAPGYADPVKKPKTSNRGRKPKLKKPKTRIQGNGKYFNSQITFAVASPTKPGKVYLFKFFRNFKFQVPGVLSSDMSDIDGPLQFLKEYFSRVLGVPTIEICDHVVQMRNCKTILSDPALTINTKALGRMIQAEQNGQNEMRINKVEYMSAQNSSRVMVKFSRPTKDKSKKKTTLKILKQKINIEGAVGYDSVDEIYEWLNDFLLDNYYNVINDPDAPVEVSDSSDTDQSSDSSSDEDGRAEPDYNPYAF